MTTTADRVQVVVFALHENEFGIDITHVREIDRLVPITRVPRVPAHVEGIINLRGQLVPVVDLRTRLGMPHSVPTKLARIIVAEIGPRSIGMIVDEVREVVRIPIEQIDKSEGVLEGLANEFIGALGRVDERLIILLDVERLLGPEAPTEPADKRNQ
ncbi:MAG TPA: chemotaxis protein CheW [Candidatus Acidoferrales bacterium]|nr:chemotaxis protein CheW [Candidatus Acidoferrales bacterium]